MTLTFNINDLDCKTDIDFLMSYALEHHRQLVIDYMESTYYSDCSTYEGGIDDWFGLGSVILYELGLTPSVQVDHSQIKLTL